MTLTVTLYPWCDSWGNRTCQQLNRAAGQANFFTASVFGAQGERCAQWLSKGRQVAIDGRLRWRSWDAKDGSKHEAVEVVADNVQFLGARESADRATNISDFDDDVPF